MIANYHTHTKRCNHASGEDIEYVQCAIEKNLKILGFSDHSPYNFHSSYYSTHRMKSYEFDGYIQSVMTLKEKFKNQITIHLGLEVEYYPNLFPELLEQLVSSPVEYIILGQHYLNDEIGSPKINKETTDKNILKKYFYQIMEGLETEKFSYIAHPDMIRYVGDKKTYQRYARELCKRAKNCGIPLEFNLLGVRKNRNYPNPLFWEVAAEENNEVVLGCDAHSPDSIADSKDINTALQFLKEYNIAPIETVTFRSLK